LNVPAFCPIFAALSPWQRLLLEWLGSDFADSPSSGRAELLWTNLPASWGVFVLIGVIAAIVYAVFTLYRREMESCPLWAKMLLASLRVCVVVLLAIIFLGPAVVYLQNRTVQPTIVVARDASQPMNTGDNYAEPAAAKSIAAILGQTETQIAATRPTRVQIVNSVLTNGDQRLLTALSRKGRLQTFDFADQVSKVELRQSSPPQDDKEKRG